MWSCTSIQWSVVTHVGTWGVSYPILFHLYICHCFRSLIVPGSQTKRLAHPEHPLHRHEHGIRVATCGHVEGISHHSFDIGFGVHQRMGYVPWQLKEPKSWKNEESMEPNDQPLFWGVDLRFFGLNLPKIWVIWVWLVVEFFKHLFTLFFCCRKKVKGFEQDSINFSGSKIGKPS